MELVRYIPSTDRLIAEFDFVTPGSMAGSLLGGCWSDYAMKKMRVANDGITYPEVGTLSFTIWTRRRPYQLPG